MKKLNCQTLVIGSGIAGLYAAIKISQKTDGKIILVTKAELETSNSRFAQGGMVAVLSENISDSVALHVKDTLSAGDGLCNKNVVQYISENSERVVKDLLKQGVEFDVDENNCLKTTLEAAHSVNRILHSGGDATGKFVELALVKKVRSIDKIQVIEHAYVTELLKDSNENCVGAVVLYDEEFISVNASNIILASGGMGQLYSNTTNPLVATADGVALALKADVQVANLEFIQFHPTALAIKTSGNRFLISEAVRGEGAILRNSKGERFMSKYEPEMELASRDKVTRAIFKEMELENSKNVWLDATHIDKKVLEKRFPTIMKECFEHGIDISKDYIPVSPAAHYSMGGVNVDINCKTSLNNLYAIGEVSHTGLHGANRLASNSLLECVVSADNVANQISKNEFAFDEYTNAQIRKYETLNYSSIENSKELKAQIQDIMWANVGIVRTKESLETAKGELENISKTINTKAVYKTAEEYEVVSMLSASTVLTKMALLREESRGAHFRTDYPEKSDVALNQIYREGKVNDEIFVA